MPTLRVRRLRHMALETFKNLNKSDPQCLQDLVVLENASSYSFRYTNRAYIPKLRTTRHELNSFRYGAASLWNSLPQHFHYHNLNSSEFKNMLQSWDGERCACASCLQQYASMLFYVTMTLCKKMF